MPIALPFAKLCPTLVTPWTVACQAPLSMGFSRQEYWSRLPFPSPGDLPNPGIEPGSPALQADSLPTELRGKTSCTYRPSVYLLWKDLCSNILPTFKRNCFLHFDFFIHI